MEVHTTWLASSETIAYALVHSTVRWFLYLTDSAWINHSMAGNMQQGGGRLLVPKIWLYLRAKVQICKGPACRQQLPSDVHQNWTGTKSRDNNETGKERQNQALIEWSSESWAIKWLGSFLRNVAKLIQETMPESFLFPFGTATYVEDTPGNLFVETCLSRQQHAVSLCLILDGQALATLAFYGGGGRIRIFWTLITNISYWQMEFVEACMICSSAQICVDSCKLARIP